jgi:hypothetical protein
MSHRLSETGGAVVANFESWLAGVQKDQAFTLKQNRLLREERANDDKRRKGGKTDHKEPGSPP